MSTPHLRLVCHERAFEPLLGELALHHPDLVPIGQAAPHNPNLRLICGRLVDLPVPLPTGHAALRATLAHWFETQGLRLLGSSDGVKEQVHAIRSRRGQHHPLVMRVVGVAMP